MTVNAHHNKPSKNSINDFEQIDLQAPWLYHISASIRDSSFYEDSSEAGLSNQLNTLLQDMELYTGKGKPLKFVPQAELDNQPTPIAYETYIADTGCIPTRDNLHDLFNAWIWLTFPKSKAMLNKYQAKAIEQVGVSDKRGKVRDAITVFDENGAVFVTSDPNIAKALKGFDWQNCLVKPREQWQPLNEEDNDKTTKSGITTATYVFGHALIEQLVKPRKPLCAHSFIILVEADFFRLSISQQIDFLDDFLEKQLESWLQQTEVSPKQLSPLPILGVPHFWEENKQVSFYEDDYVFRSGRRKK